MENLEQIPSYKDGWGNEYCHFNDPYVELRFEQCTGVNKFGFVGDEGDLSVFY